MFKGMVRGELAAINQKLCELSKTIATIEYERLKIETMRSKGSMREAVAERPKELCAICDKRIEMAGDAHLSLRYNSRHICAECLHEIYSDVPLTLLQAVRTMKGLAKHKALFRKNYI